MHAKNDEDAATDWRLRLFVYLNRRRNLRRGVTTSGMSDVEKLAFSVDASLRGSDSKSSAGASRGVRLVARLSASCRVARIVA